MRLLAPHRYSLGVILLVGGVVRLALLIVNQEFATLPQGGGDAIVFERLSWAHAQVGGEGWASYLRSSSDFIVLLGSAIYGVTGRAPYVLGLGMVTLGLGVVYLTYQTALELWEDESVARIVGWSTTLFPQLVLHSALFLREMPVSFCLAAAALCAVRFVKRTSIVHSAWFAFWIGLGTLFHSGVIFAIPGLFLGTVLIRRRLRSGMLKHHATNVAAGLILASLIFLANSTGFGLGKFGGSLTDAVERFEAQEEQETTGGAAYPEWLRVRGGVSDAWKIPVRFSALLLSPVAPFMVRSPRHLFGVLDAALYLLLLWSACRNWSIIREQRAAGVLLTLFVVLCLVYALGVSNFGTAIRHRAKMAPLILLVGAGLGRLRVLRRQQALYHQDSKDDNGRASIWAS